MSDDIYTGDIDKIIDTLMTCGNVYKVTHGDGADMIFDNRETFDEIYHRLKSMANDGNLQAIKLLYSIDDILWMHYPDITEELDFAGYLSKLSVSEIIKFVHYFPGAKDLFEDSIEQKVEVLEKENLELKKRIVDLETKIDYMPGCAGYRKAKLEFDSIVYKT